MPKVPYLDDVDFVGVFWLLRYMVSSGEKREERRTGILVVGRIFARVLGVNCIS